MSSGPTAPATPAAPSRAALLVLLCAGLAGLGVAAYLMHLHVQAHAGIASFCSINETVNCDKVATSPYSVVLGLPVAVWGALGYLAALVLVGWGLSSKRLHPAWPAGLLSLFGAAACGAAVALALVSKLWIGAWCLLCVAAWICSAVLWGAAIAACRPAGTLAAVRADLAALRARPALTGGLAAAAAAVLALLAAFYPRYWEHSRAAELLARPPAASAALASKAELFSDYECPYCAVAHQELVQIQAARPYIKVARRHFPLDNSCNPVMKRPLHADACAYARVAICAEAQGKFEAMDDALFANQQEKRPLPAIALKLGLDMEKLAACMSSPETEARLQADIAAAVAAGVRSTPTYVVDGANVGALLPVERFAPPGR